MAGLTTHVLDTSIGRPAAGVEIELHALSADGARAPIKRVHTNADGRTDAPLLSAAEARVGEDLAKDAKLVVSEPFAARVKGVAEPLSVVRVRLKG